MTSTPSRIACATAAAESEGKQPSSPQTLYSITHAPGATPLIGPRSTPKIGALSTMLPAAVVVVCVPWPLLSRAESGYDLAAEDRRCTCR